MSEEQLRHHIRNEKQQLQTGDADEKSGKVALQPLEYYEQVVKQSNGHAKRNILAEQDRLATAMAPSTPKPNAAEKKDIKPAQPTKAQMLNTQANSIASLSANYSAIHDIQSELLRHKSDLTKLEKLKQGLALGLLTQQEFKAKAKILLFNF